MIESKINAFMLQIQSFKFNYSEQSEIEQSVKELIKIIIDNIVENALDEFSNISESSEPLKHIELIDRNGYPQINSDTGSLDFSKPTYRMLNDLLKNAKISKEGKKYKVIPIGKKDGKMDSVKDISAGATSMRNVSPMGDMVADMAAAFNSGANDKIIKQTSSSTSSKQEFRTASEKQDPASMWVVPEKKINIETETMLINSRIILNIDEAVDNILKQKIQELDRES